MALRISNKLKASLPSDQRMNLEAILMSRGDRCHLCGAPLDFENETVVVDHVEPQAQGGSNDLSNLLLAHSKCNSFKKDNPVELVRPFLHFQKEAEKIGRMKYGDVKKHCGIKTIECELTTTNNEIRIHNTGGTDIVTPLLEEPKPDASKEIGKQKTAYALIPFSLIWNDDSVQPRAIYPKHIWNLVKDLYRNPLHEAPSVRIEESPSGKKRLVMFDGQHKSVAMMLHGRESCVFKIYIDYSAEEATVLVNSIQSRLIKQGLSDIESADKFSGEFNDSWKRYASEKGEDASEKDFIDSLPSDDRSRARIALRSALVSELINDSELKIRPHLSPKRTGSSGLTEKTFIKSLLMKLINTKALVERSEQQRALRSNEQQNFITLANLLFEHALAPLFEQNAEESDRRRARRLSKQPALNLFAAMANRCFINVVQPNNDDMTLMQRIPSQEQWLKIEQALKRWLDHPFWRSEKSLGSAVAKADNHLERNEAGDLSEAFEIMGLTSAYAILGEPLPRDWQQA